MNVANKAIIRRLTARLLIAAKTRNIIAVTAIALTSVMFTSVFTLGGNMITALQDQTMRQIGTSSHGALKFITREQYENFSQSPLLRDISYSLILGEAENGALRKIQHEIRYAEDKKAKWNFSLPSVGKMPQAMGEAACSTITLDALGVPHEIGAPVPLEFTVGGVTNSETFTLSGFWTGDPIMMAQMIWLSESYVQKVLSENTITDNITGTLYADVWFGNTFDIEGKIQRLIAESGYAGEEIAYGVSWAYAANMISYDPAVIAITALVLALILLAGYLIIYSIFVISTNTDIHFFGLLKTIGTTGRQIRRIVRGQALILSAIGIPIGLLLGWFSGVGLTPLMLNFFSELGISKTSANPLIFILAAVFSLLTVFIGCRKPSKIAAQVSPVEAVKYSGVTNSNSRKAKKTRPVTPFRMAWANITREKRKFAITVLSLSLSLILLNSAFSATKSFDMDAYLSGSLISDFAVADYSIFVSGRDKNTRGVTHDFLMEAQARGGEISNIYYHGEAAAQVYGVSETAPAYHEMLSAGNYAIVSRHIINIGDSSVRLPEAGDTITLTNDTGITRDFEVAGHIDTYPSQISARFRAANSLDVIIADKAFLDFFSEVQPMQANINVDPEIIDEFESWLAVYTLNQNPDLQFISRNTLKAEFDGLQTTYLAIGSSLSFILALVGVLNFINAIAASVIARRRELAMLQSVGMTGKQLRHTLFFEGGYYAVLSLCFTLTVGAALGIMIVQVIAGQLWFFKQSFTVIPSVICAVPLLIICAAVPLVSYKWLARESLVQRLRID